jgi:hypothetical protein
LTQARRWRATTEEDDVLSGGDSTYSASVQLPPGRVRRIIVEHGGDARRKSAVLESCRITRDTGVRRHSNAKASLLKWTLEFEVRTSLWTGPGEARIVIGVRVAVINHERLNPIPLGVLVVTGALSAILGPAKHGQLDEVAECIHIASVRPGSNVPCLTGRNTISLPVTLSEYSASVPAYPGFESC